MKGLFRLFAAPPEAPRITDVHEIEKGYAYWRIRVFSTMFFGYAFYYFSRKSFTFAMPALMADLHLTKQDLGILASILSIAYGVSKFTSGIIGDRSNPRTFMAFGLVITGLINILFGFSSSIAAFAVLWGLNGFFQGFGWPPCARLLTHWYSQKERGRWWGIWSTSHNVGGALIPILATYCAHMWGWRAAMWVPGVLCIFAGLFIYNRLRDTPQSLGLPSIEEYHGEKVLKSQKAQISVKEALFDFVLRNRWIWLLAGSYFFLYVVRTAVNDWTLVYLIEERGYSQGHEAGSIVSAFEIGGFCGMLVAGWSSDRFFQGRRGPIMILYMMTLLLPIFVLGSDLKEDYLIDFSLLFSVGFCIFGPQMLVGCAAAELSHKQAAATATGFVGCFAYIGAACAGYPFGFIIDTFGWSGYWMVLGVSSVASLIFLLPLWSLSSSPNEKPLQEASQQAA